MSYNPTLASENAFAFLTGAKSAANNNATPDTVEPANTGWLTLPVAATDGLALAGSVLLRGIVSSTQACQARIGDNNQANNIWEQANLKVARSGTTDGLGAEVSDDEIILQRDDATVIIQMIEKYNNVLTAPGPSFDATYPRFIAWRMA
tara:strand:- start:4059 stop:4505 length:447 start_codon:yes stop_codon:yes gene_type:complete